jgi:DNA polymerase elongation subunit (family B)
MLTVTSPCKIKGWILDAYPSKEGEITVWIISEAGQRIRLIDKFQPKIYASSKQENIDPLIGRLYNNPDVAKWRFAYKYAQPPDSEKSKVLELSLKDCRKTTNLTNNILRMGDYMRYQVSNCDLKGDRAYFFSHDIFPLAFIEVKVEKTGLQYNLLDSVASTDYAIPPFRVMKLNVEVAKTNKIAEFNDPIGTILVNQDQKEILIESGDETEKLQQLVKVVKELDPDFLVTSGGDSHLFPYLTERATINDVIDKFTLSRDGTPFSSKTPSGKTFFSYGRTFYRAGTIRLYGRIHIDESNTFVLSEAGFDGLIEIARTCRVPLHTAARNSIGSSMSSLQFYQAITDDVLIPRNKSIPEAFKSAYDLLVGDRGGMVYEPRVGAHDFVGEVDFSNMYPSIMADNNISAETVLCKCCPDSPLRIPELNYNICTKRRGIVPKTLRFVVDKRLFYKKMKKESPDPHLREVYDNRQIALKWILVTCFGYLGYKNAKFGTVDGHIGVCAFGREALLDASHTAEDAGFEVIHGIVDSLWLKKPDASLEDYENLCKAITKQSGIPISFEGRYKWIVFLPSKTHPRVGVLNRYYGVMEDGKIKVRGLEIRKRDTPKFVFDVQTEMINTLATANNIAELRKQIPTALNIVRKYRQKLLDDEVPIEDLVISKRMSKNPEQYHQHVSQVIAAKQLIKQGTEVHAGNSVRFLFTHSKDKRHGRRVKAAQLIEKDVEPDTEKYLQLLYSAAANMLSFDGYTTELIYDSIRDKKQKSLPAILRIVYGEASV